MFNRILSLFGTKTAPDEAVAIYRDIVAQARIPVFYSACGVPDTLDGRFDMIVLHAYLTMRRLTAAGEAGQTLSQALFDLMFADMDSSLREIGVGDLSVGKKVKVMAQAFYGRAEAYEAGLAAPDDDTLIAALNRNLYGTMPAQPAEAARMVAYMRAADVALRNQPDSELLGGKAAFPAPTA